MKEIKKFQGRRAKIAQLLNDGLSVKEVTEKCSCPQIEVYNVKNSAIYQDWQRSQALAELGGEGAKVAIQTLLEVARDKKAASQSRVSASDKLLHYTGIKLDSEGNIEKTPANMSASELQQRLVELQKEALNRAKPVNIIEGESQEVKEDNIDELIS